MTNFFKCLLLSGVFLILEVSAWAQLPSGFVQLQVQDELNPTDMVLVPDGRIFITQKDGRILIIENGVPVLDPLMTIPVDDFNERGLGHIVLDPDFLVNGYFYLYYTVAGANHNRVSRFTAVGNLADPASEVVLLDLDNLATTIHNGGAMLFAPDGKLYVSVGDGGAGYLAQDLNSLAGKVLRINPDGSIPADNPFYNQLNGNYRAIYAYGFRNPYTMTIQPSTGTIFLCDVGQATWEEVNHVMAGMNYGWPIIEGPYQGGQLPPAYHDPIYYYNHTDGCAAIGGAFYNPVIQQFPAQYQGMFFYGDYCQGYINFIDPMTGLLQGSFATGIARPISIRVADNGDLYYLARAGLGGGSMQDNTITYDGVLWRVFYTGSAAPFVYQDPQDALVVVGETASFQVFAVGDQPITYQWQINGVDIPGATADTLAWLNAQMIDSGAVITCILNNAFGSDTSGAAILHVTQNQRPVPVILLPATGTMYQGGTVLDFEGYASDPETGALPATALTWRIVFHHDTHTHPGMSPTSGIFAGTYNIPNTGETEDNVWYRVYLTATDSLGLSQTVHTDVYPDKVTLNISSQPIIVDLNMDGDVAQTPVAELSVVGIERNFSVPGSIIVGDTMYLFDSWSDGAPDADRTFLTPNVDVFWTANYIPVPLGEGNGLIGNYYEPDLAGNVVLNRIDPVIDFQWGGGSPQQGVVPNDNFAARWDGFVQPYFNDTYEFFTITDDGVRLWVDSILIIDQWILQGATEHTGMITLQGGVKYPIRMEYFEAGGDAVAVLGWRGTQFDQHIIPQSQLFTQLPTGIAGIVWLDTNNDGVKDSLEVLLEDAALLIYAATNGAIVGATTTDYLGRYSFNELPADDYYIYALPPIQYNSVLPGFNLNAQSLTATFTVNANQMDSLSMAFYPLPLGTTAPDTKQQILAYPNPASQTLHVFFAQAPENVLSYQLFDMFGKEAASGTWNAGSQRQQLDLAPLQAGVYLLSICSNESHFSLRVVVVR